jgi:PAS domain S-box-containing protein
MQSSSDEPQSRRTLRDLVALSAFSSIWTGNQPVQVAKNLADVLLNTLPLDFVYLRLRSEAGGLEPEVVCTGRLPIVAGQAREIGQALAPWLNNGDTTLVHTIPNPVGSGMIWLLRAPLGQDGGEGVAVAASRQSVFPSEDDRLLLSVGASHAGIVLRRSRAEAEMRTLNAALENAVEGVARLDTEGKYLSVNRAYAEMLGVKPEELIGGTWPQSVHTDDLPQVEAAYQRMLREDPVELEVRALRKDQSVFWKHVTIVKTCNEQGQRIGYYCFMKDISERKQSENDLRRLAARLQDLSRRAIDVQEQERRHLARELHDEIGQILSTISVNLQANREYCNCDSGTRLEDSITIVNDAIQQVRNLSLDLRPSMLDDLGLISTLRWCANRQAQTAGFELSFVAESSGAQLPADVEIACYRIIQEALTNVVRHAQARHVSVEVRQQEEEIELVICDDGIGFNLDTVRRGAARGGSFGVLGMEERVEILGGKIELKSQLGHGTRIQVRFSFAPNESSNSSHTRESHDEFHPSLARR